MRCGLFWCLHYSIFLLLTCDRLTCCSKKEEACVELKRMRVAFFACSNIMYPSADLLGCGARSGHEKHAHQGWHDGEQGRGMCNGEPSFLGDAARCAFSDLAACRSHALPAFFGLSVLPAFLVSVFSLLFQSRCPPCFFGLSVLPVFSISASSLLFRCRRANVEV